MLTETEITAIRNDPCTSYWLRNTLDTIEQQARDPLDALADAEVLVDILKARFTRIAEAVDAPTAEDLLEQGDYL